MAILKATVVSCSLILSGCQLGVSNDSDLSNSTHAAIGNGNSQVTANGIPDVTANGIPDVTANGIPDVTANGIPDVTANGVPNVTANGVPNVTANGLIFGQVTANGVCQEPGPTGCVTANGLAQSALDGNSPLVDRLLDFDHGAVFLRYLALCALNPDQSIAIEHNGEELVYDGTLGLAPAWSQRGLNDSEARWLSACLLAHTNAVGASVFISTRAVGELAASADDQAQYSTYEGTFFGKMFNNAPVEIYSCIGDDANIALANSDDRVSRICADDTEDCTIVSLGRCRDVCETRTANHGWSGCWADGVRYDETISVYLHSDDRDGNNATCGAGEDCNFTIKKDEAGILDCSESDDCRAVCKKGSVCAIDGTGADSFKAVVKHDSIADINCHEANSCKAKIKSNSSAEIDCKDANTCRSGVICTDGADCLLDCTGAADCGFKTCEGQLTQCEGDIWVCNRDCPLS